MTGFECAKKYLGLEEVRDKAQLEALFKTYSHNHDMQVDPQETSWCADFMNCTQREAGGEGTGRLNAQSFKTYGTPVSDDDWRQGDILVFKFPSDQEWQGHVTYLNSWDDANNVVNCLGGNQSNKVCYANYSQDYVVSVRRGV